MVIKLSFALLFIAIIMTSCVVDPDETYTASLTFEASDQPIAIEEMTTFVNGAEVLLVDLLALHLVTQAILSDDIFAGRHGCTQ